MPERATTSSAGREPGHVVIVGASVAGIRTAQALRGEGFDGELTVIGAESAAPYDKPPLSKQVLTGEQEPADIGLLRPHDDFGLRLGDPAAGLDPARKVVTLAGGDRIRYGTLIIATGVRARTLPGTDPELAVPVRDLADATRLRGRLASGSPVAIIGGGFIGAEVAAAAAASGCPATIIEALPAPFAGVLGPEVGSLVTALHTAHGVTVIPGTKVAGVGPGHVRLADGRILEGGTIVAGVGCVPNTGWLDGSGLPLDDGVRTDEHCAVPGADGVFAIGDVARWLDRASGTHRRVEHWTNAVEQASLVSRQIMRPGHPRHHDAVPYFWSDQHGVKIQMVGRAGPGDRVEAVRYATRSGTRIAALYGRDGRLTAAVTFGWPRASVAARQAWQRGGSVNDLRNALGGLADGVTALDLTAPGAAIEAAAEMRAAAGSRPATPTTPAATTGKGN